MIRSSSFQVEVKGETQEYGFGHGSYDPYKSNMVFLNEGEVSLTLRFRMKKLPCKYRDFYKSFAVGQLLRPGKLWAIVNNEIVWTTARLTSWSDDENAQRDEYIINIDFILPEGVWHKANKATTFLVPYNVCTFMDCKGFKKVNPCQKFPLDGDCCTTCKRDKALIKEDDCECCCGKLKKDMALCYHDDLQSFYETCVGTYRIVSSCKRGKEFFSDRFLGEKICATSSDGSTIAGHFYSETDIPTSSMQIVIDGSVHDPQISINDNTNIIKGDYDRLYISSNGDVYSEDGNNCRTLLDPSVWIVPTSNDEYGWTIHQGENRLIINTGTCCGRACAYIQMDNLTI